MLPAIHVLMFDEFGDIGWDSQPDETLQSVHYRCLLAVQTIIRNLHLNGIDSDNIVVRKLPWPDRILASVDNPVTLPCIIISPFGQENADRMQGTNRRDDIGYPVHVALTARDNQDLISNLNKYLLWRQRLMRAFQNSTLQTIVGEVYTAYIETRPIVAPGDFANGYWSSCLNVRCVARVPRLATES